jgi:hypothetical protein
VHSTEEDRYRNRSTYLIDRIAFSIGEFAEHVSKMVKVTIQIQNAPNLDDLADFANFTA